MNYSERVWPSLWWWLMIVGLAATMAIALLPLAPTLWPVVSALVLIGGGITLTLASYRIEVEADQLRVGKARISLDYLTEPLPIKADQWSTALAHSQDATTYVVARPWVRTGISLSIADPRDRVSTWVIGTRHPRQLCEVITAYAAHSEQTGKPFSS